MEIHVLGKRGHASIERRTGHTLQHDDGFEREATGLQMGANRSPLPMPRLWAPTQTHTPP
jgi:hypothetical protein